MVGLWYDTGRQCFIVNLASTQVRMAMMNPQQQKWTNLLRAWSVPASLADLAFEEISRHYASPGRFYHTLDHIRDVVDRVETHAAHTRNLNAVKLAAWLHDVIYDSRASDNEELSAAYAQELCKKLSIPDGPLVASLILKTKTHDAGNDPDAQVLTDADLAILGTSDWAYRDYADKIRQEYAWVPENDYRLGRTRALQRFLARPKIFHLLEDLEEPARRNTMAEITRLTPSK